MKNAAAYKGKNALRTAARIEADPESLLGAFTGMLMLGMFLFAVSLVVLAVMG